MKIEMTPRRLNLVRKSAAGTMPGFLASTVTRTGRIARGAARGAVAGGMAGARAGATRGVRRQAMPLHSPRRNKRAVKHI